MSLLYRFWTLTPPVEVSGKMPSVFKELCRPINSNSAQYHESATYHHLGARVSDIDTQDGKDGGEKEAEMRMFLSISLKDATHRVHQKQTRAFLEECRRSSKLWMESSITVEKDSWGR